MAGRINFYVEARSVIVIRDSGAGEEYQAHVRKKCLLLAEKFIRKYYSDINRKYRVIL